jgi:hypothetical protein
MLVPSERPARGLDLGGQAARRASPAQLANQIRNALTRPTLPNSGPAHNHLLSFGMGTTPGPFWALSPMGGRRPRNDDGGYAQLKSSPTARV